ncbi:hypothetical protein [Streptomyces sp. NPDC054834]
MGLIDLPWTGDAADGGRDVLDAEERGRARGFVRDWAGARYCGVRIALRRLLTLRRRIRSFAACTSSRSCSSLDSGRLMTGVVARSTAWPWHYYYAKGEAEGTTQQVHNLLPVRIRRAHGRSVEPTAAVIDAQSVKTSANVAESSQGID